MIGGADLAPVEPEGEAAAGPATDPAALALLERLDAEIAQPRLPWPQVLDFTVRRLAEARDHYHWTGIYWVQGRDLVLGPYVGRPTEHVRIPIGRGICGAAAAQGQTVIVDEVGQDPRYLACFASTRSEIVVPILAQGGQGDAAGVLGEIDVDSDQPAAFGPADRALLEAVASRLGRLFALAAVGGDGA